MAEMAKTLIFIGILFLIIGAGLYFLAKVPGAGKLPGDIVVRKENFSFYFPLTTCIIISVILSLIFYFLNR